MAQLWLLETADHFWTGAGTGEFVPDLEEAVLMGYPLNIERIDGLSVRQVESWLLQRDFPLPGLTQVKERRLRACLVAHGHAHNFIFLDKNDSPAEQRFSVAHEIAHFLLDYVRPRQKAQSRLVPSILEVMDGLRPATLEERLQGLLEGIWVGQYEHFMERDGGGNILSGRVLLAEDQADTLALELLAPEELALPLVQFAIQDKPTYALRLEAAAQALAQKFLLPPTVAHSYAVILVKIAGGETTVREWLGL